MDKSPSAHPKVVPVECEKRWEFRPNGVAYSIAPDECYDRKRVVVEVKIYERPLSPPQSLPDH